MSIQRSISADEVVAERLLTNKMSDVAEIEIHLFENCNISCGYCSQDHNDGGPNRDSFERKRSIAVQYMDKLSKKNDK